MQTGEMEHADGQNGAVIHGTHRESQKQTGLADTRVANQKEFEQIVAESYR